MVGEEGLEPTISALSEQRSNHLNYSPIKWRSQGDLNPRSPA